MTSAVRYPPGYLLHEPSRRQNSAALKPIANLSIRVICGEQQNRNNANRISFHRCSSSNMGVLIDINCCDLCVLYSRLIWASFWLTVPAISPANHRTGCDVNKNGFPGLLMQAIIINHNPNPDRDLQQPLPLLLFLSCS